MRQIRQNIFETNSSSVHSLTICSEEEYNKWRNNELVFDAYDDRLVKINIEFSENDKVNSKKQYEKEKSKYWKEWDQLSDYEVNEWYRTYMYEHKKIDPYRYFTYDDFFNATNLETYQETYTTKNGEKIIAFGKYGYDG